MMHDTRHMTYDAICIMQHMHYALFIMRHVHLSSCGRCSGHHAAYALIIMRCMHSSSQPILQFEHDEFHLSALALHVTLSLCCFINHFRHMVVYLLMLMSNACSWCLRPAHTGMQKKMQGFACKWYYGSYLKVLTDHYTLNMCVSEAVGREGLQP